MEPITEQDIANFLINSPDFFERHAQLLASVQQQRGQVLRAIRAEAEAQVARQDLPAALDRLRAAQDWIRRSPSAGGAAVDHIEASIIDTRAREVAALLREQALER